MVTGALLTLLVFQTTADNGPYATPETADLIAIARTRHAATDSTIRDYHATVHTRIDLTQSRGRFAQQKALGVVEYVTTLDWSHTGDIQVEYKGLRKQYAFQMMPGPLPFFDIDQDDLNDPRIDEPWFVPLTLGDRIHGVCCDWVERPALHPLAPGAAPFYRYAIQDSMEIRTPSRSLKLIAVDVVPQVGSEELVMGRMWIETESGQVARFVMKFVGDRLFASNPGDILNRVFRLEADIEYGEIDGFWLPSRQMVTLEAHDDWITGSALLLRFHVEFEDYQINAGSTVVAAADQPVTVPLDSVVTDDPAVLEAIDVVRGSLRLDDQGEERLVVGSLSQLVAAIRLLEEEGIDSGLRINSGNSQSGERFSTRTTRNDNRWTVASAAIDSLSSDEFWDEPLPLARDVDVESQWRAARGILDSLADRVPSDVRVPGQSGLFRWGETVRYNRVQGVTLGGRYVAPPRIGTWSVQSAGARLGMADQRPVFETTFARTAPFSTLEVRAFRTIQDVDPFSDGTSFGNTLNALLTGHDDADYLLASGGGLRWNHILGAASEWSLAVGVEDHRTVTAEAGGGLFGGAGRTNPPVEEGVWGRAGVTLDGRGGHAVWRLGVDALGNDQLVVGRAWGGVLGTAGPLSITLRGGVGSDNTIPQMALRAGGPATVRGHAYGERTGAAMWTAQADLAFPSVLRVRPFVFTDVGNAATTDALFSQDPLIGAGAGIAVPLILVEFRLEVSAPLGDRPDHAARVDLRLVR